MNNLYIVMYHYVRPIAGSEYPNIKGLELDYFREQLRFFMDNFHIVNMEQVIDAIYNQEPIPEHALLLTFDDGYLDHYKYVFPILKENGVQGSFFVPSGILRYGKVLDVNKIHFILACNSIDILTGEIYRILDEYRNEGYDIESNETLFEKLAIANRWDIPEVIFIKRLLQTYLEEGIRKDIVDRLFVESVGTSESEFSKKLYMNLAQIKEMKNSGMYFCWRRICFFTAGGSPNTSSSCSSPRCSTTAMAWASGTSAAGASRGQPGR